MARDWRALLLMVLPFLLGATPAGCASPPTGATSTDLLPLLQERILRESFTGKRVYVARDPLPAAATVSTWRTGYSVPRDYPQAWFFFIDDAPDANWEHACRYVFVDVESQRHVVIPSRTPPTGLADMRRLYPAE